VAIRHLEYTRGRLAEVSTRLALQVYRETRPVDELLVSGAVDRIPWDEAQRLQYHPVALGERFGPLWATYWFRARATVPEEWRGARVDLLWDSRSEATLWLGDRVEQGLNPHHTDAVLSDAAEPGELSWQVELACNGLFGAQAQPPELRRCELGQFDPEAWQLLFDFETLRALEAQPALDPSFAGELRGELNRFCNVWPLDPAAARELLSALYERRNASRVHELSTLGHAHLDTAWLWPLAETYRKAVRTLSTQLRYMHEYPEYRFAHSQAQQYAWIKDRAPELWERVRDYVRAGRLVPVGGTWVEPDCNIPSGESLARQFLHGQRFFERELGARCREFWSPDAFGYPAQLPQLMRGAGIDRFLTQKLSWNRFTRPEHHTFVWQGLDGSEVLAHFPPADNYSSDATIGALVTAANAYKDHEHSRASLLLFGFGDGGGGPTRAMLETLRRTHDLQGVPRTAMRTSDEFFGALEAEPGERPVVAGELYLEYHRGTYTTHARTKRANRRCEQALHDAEFLSCLRGGPFPRAELDRLWKRLLLNQFHDILPGSSIGLVYKDAERDFAEIEAGANAICGVGATPVNTTGFRRREVVEDPRGELVVIDAPSYARGRVVTAQERVDVNGLVLQNAHLRAELSPDGSLLSLLHKASERETLAAAGNCLELYDDHPIAFDAWDIDPFHLETRRECPPAESVAVLSAGPLRAEVAFERAIGEVSRFTQVVRLDATSRRLEFHTTVEWHEGHALLKVCFPLAVRSLRATYETAFGYVERPTHFSTSADQARYEVPGHRFADLSEHGFGAAVVTDCKYGYSCHGNELRVSLLRAPKSPDPDADMGRHEFAYALFPHAGGWRDGGVVGEAVRFNSPFHWTDTDVPDGAFSEVDDPNLVLDTIKPAEDSDALVLRLYEAHGGRGTARVRVASPFASARHANLLEDDGDPLEVDEGAIVIPYRPHEIVTVKLS
jgi:alpha-mannosidase